MNAPTLNIALAQAIKTGGLAQQGTRMRQPRKLKGKAVLVIDAVMDIHDQRGYDIESRIKSCSGDHCDDAYLELHHCCTVEKIVPHQCKRMDIGDRWHIDVVFVVNYTPTIDHEGNEDWDVAVAFLKAKTLNKSPWNDKRHARYVSKAKRAAA